jgi:hypothetical protein
MKDDNLINANTAINNKNNDEIIPKKDFDKKKYYYQSLKKKPLRNELNANKNIRIDFEKKQLIDSIKEKIIMFDSELKILRHERNRVSVLIKNAYLRNVTIYEEFMLLRDFEKTENDLEIRLSIKKDEHVEFQVKLNDLQLKIEHKRKDIEKIDEHLRQLLQNLSQIIHDETKYSEFLTKVYKRKIKRRKKVDGEEEDESDEESDESDDDDEDLENEDENSEGEGKEQLDLDICPSDLKQDLYDQICHLRDKRLDFEEVQAEEKKNLEQLRKDLDGMTKKAKITENSLKQAQQELENFQVNYYFLRPNLIILINTI